MPAFPGLQGMESCLNWDPPFPLDLETIEDSDVDYWQLHQGTPKGFILLDNARTFWANDLGELTGIKILPDRSEPFQDLSAAVRDEYRNLILDHLDENIGHSDAGLTINTVKTDSLETARGLSIFPMMFLAFGMIIILAGILLIVNIFITQAEARRFELGLIRALGFKRKQLTKILVVEGLLYAVIASILGVIFGLAIGYFLIQGLNSIWSDAVEGNIIPFHFNLESLVIAFLAGFIVTIITILLISLKIGKTNIIHAMRSVSSEKDYKKEFDLNKRRLTLLSFILILIFNIILFLFTLRVLKGQPHTDLELNLLLISPPIMIIGGFCVIVRFTVYKNSIHPKIRKINRMILTFIGLVILIYTILLDLVMFKNPDIPFLALYFISGILLVFSSVLIVVTNLNWLVTKLNSGLGKLSGKSSNSVFKLATLYPVRSLKRTGMTIGLFALVLFIIAALGVNIAIQTANISEQATTTGGGYDILGESNLPVKFDLSDPAELGNNDITSPTLSTVDVTPIKMVGEEGGTCSNMNVRYPPRLLGVDEKFRSTNKFGFSSSKWDIDDSNQIWSGLNLELDNNRIPIVVEYNTLVWIYEKELGSIFDLVTESGETIELEVVAITESSILSGSFILSEENLDRLYPRSAEYHLFLFKLKNDSDDANLVATSLEQELSELGLDTVTIEDRLLEDVRYEQSFMALFQVFLGLGLIIGIVGLGVITLRAIQERRWEIGMLRAIGFKRKMILKLFLTEIFFVVLIGITIGILVGILSSYLSFSLWKGASYEFVVPWESLLILGFIVLEMTSLCAFYPAYKASKIPPVEALRCSE
jgi:putative ABC transport system permease protein